MTLENAEAILERFHRTLVDEIRASNPRYLEEPFTVAEIYQQLVPYRTHRDAIGVEINGDYEDALLRLLAGEGGYLELDSPAARDRIVEELETKNPDTTLYREFAAVEVRLRSAGPEREEAGAASTGSSQGPTPSDSPEPEEPEPVEPETEVRSMEEPRPSACRSCRTPLPDRDDLVFCPHCGADQRLVPCPSCGTDLEPDWRFCIVCGHAMENGD